MDIREMLILSEILVDHAKKIKQDTTEHQRMLLKPHMEVVQHINNVEIIKSYVDDRMHAILLAVVENIQWKINNTSITDEISARQLIGYIENLIGIVLDEYYTKFSRDELDLDSEDKKNHDRMIENLSESDIRDDFETIDKVMKHTSKAITKIVGVDLSKLDKDRIKEILEKEVSEESKEEFVKEMTNLFSLS